VKEINPMKANRSLHTSSRVNRWIQSVALRRLACVAVGLSALCLGAPETRAQEVILRPGEIAGEIRLMDPYNTEEPLPITYIQVQAIGSSGGVTYSASRTIQHTRFYSITVEAGDWPYTVSIYARATLAEFGRTLVFNWSSGGVLVQENQTTTKDFITDAFLDIEMDVTGETVEDTRPSGSCTLGPGESFSFSVYGGAWLPSPQVFIPVTSPIEPPPGYGRYRVNITGRMQGLTGSLSPEQIVDITVNSGETVPVLFNIEPGYIEGTIALAGATFNSGTVSITTFKTENNRSGSATATVGYDNNQLSYRFPCVPALNPNVRVRCTLNTDLGTYTGEYQYPQVLPGQTAVCDWVFDFTASISGTVNVEGFPMTGSNDRIEISASGPNRSVSKTRYGPSDGSYEFGGLSEGLWSVSARRRFYFGTTYEGASCNRRGEYRFLGKQVELSEGEHAIVDFGFAPGFVTGRLLDLNSGALPLLYGSRTYFQGGDSNERIDEVYATTPWANPRPEYANQFWSFARPGDWQLTNARLYFRFDDPTEVRFLSELSITDRLAYSPHTWNLPPMSVAEDTTTEQNVEYKTGMVKVRFRVADGRPLSSPSVTGNYVKPGEPRDKTVSLSGSANSLNVQEGMVHLYAVPGTYQLSARATVSGSSTTFGQPFLVTVDPGDVIETDPEAPEVNVTFPPGEYVTCEDSLTIIGTVTDASGVASFSINGQTVDLDEHGNFTFVVTDLEIGNNILHFEAVDIYGKGTTLDRTVIRNGIPVAHDDAYSLYDDEVLIIPAPGVLANDTDPDNDPLTVTARTDPTVGVLEMTSDGAFSYWPVQRVGGLYSFTYTIEDGKCGSSTATVMIEVKVRNQPPTIESLTLRADSIQENDTIWLDLAIADPDIGDTHTVTVDWNDGTVEEIAVEMVDGQAELVLSHLCLDDGPSGIAHHTYTVSVTVTDSFGEVATGSLEYIVHNVPPVIETLTGPIEPLPDGTEIVVEVTFTDVGTLDTHIVDFDWGDGTVTVVELALGARSASASHTYAGPGVYVVTVTVTDDDTGSATASSEYVVLYDPTAGFVTGGGWIQSPPGAYRSDPSIVGKAHFGFVSRYKKGATVPSGNTEFRFQAADLDFRATDFEWLVIAGAQAKFKGWGQINRQGDYGFMVSARDSALPGGGDADAFRIQIWDRATEIVVYDNQFEDDELADATTAIGGGAITIHAK
jgi:hypothetical protein